MSNAQREVRIRNRLGMHARAAVKFVQLANQFRAEVKVLKDGNDANGKSIMGLLTLVAAVGSTFVPAPWGRPVYSSGPPPGRRGAAATPARSTGRRSGPSA